ncbi:DDE superfamily endonuclease [Palleronia aestuarii]|uniref:DDE superfamily endonuclease n=1 Tax=Palleronia aestuarii TaxID=568105 RepID=A0A2W7PPX3_9RHOB|nr:transposase [Palleronia aestuarii]PZX11429.1 DDE superfamily endonuclease [Palleronia aestuarii]
MSAKLSSIHRALIRAEFSYKKGLIAQERMRAGIRLVRCDWTVRRQPFMRGRAHRLVFIDETAVKANMTRLRGRSAVGERLLGTASFGRWQAQTFIAGLTCDALMASWVIDGAMDRTAFDIYVETQLALALSPGTVFVGNLIHWIKLFSSSLLDNLSTHKAPRRSRS